MCGLGGVVTVSNLTIAQLAWHPIHYLTVNRPHKYYKTQSKTINKCPTIVLFYK